MGLPSAAIGAAGGIVKMISGAKHAREARQALENYQRQNLENVFRGLSVSTRGADLQREELARAQATSVGALRAGGARNLIGGVGQIHGQSIAGARQIGADLDIRQKEIDQLRAGDEARIRQMQEQREQADLAGLGQQYNVGRQDLFGGLGDITQSAMSFGNQMAYGSGFNMWGGLFGGGGSQGQPAQSPQPYAGYNPQTGTSGGPRY